MGRAEQARNDEEKRERRHRKNGCNLPGRETQHDGAYLNGLKGGGHRRPGRPLVSAKDSTLLLDRLALRPHVRNHPPGNAHLDIRRDFEFELGIVHYSRNLADQASGHNHAVALARILDEIFMLLRLLPLRPDNQKIRDNKDYREGHKLHDHVHPTGSPGNGCLGESRCEQNPFSSILSSLKTCVLQDVRLFGARI